MKIQVEKYGTNFTELHVENYNCMDDLTEILTLPSPIYEALNLLLRIYLLSEITLFSNINLLWGFFFIFVYI